MTRARKISWIGTVLRECPGDEQSAGRAADRLDAAARAAASRRCMNLIAGLDKPTSGTVT